MVFFGDQIATMHQNQAGFVLKRSFNYGVDRRKRNLEMGWNDVSYARIPHFNHEIHVFTEGFHGFECLRHVTRKPRGIRYDETYHVMSFGNR